MSQKKNKYSLTSARNTLRLFFGDSDSVSPQTIFQNTGRIGKSDDANNSYLYNKLSLLRHYDLIITHKEPDESGVIRIKGISLTQAGKDLRASESLLGQESPIQLPSRDGIKQVSLQSITEDVDEFNRQNPSWKLELDIKRTAKGGS